MTAKDGTTREVTARTILIATGGWPFLPQHCPGVTEYGLTSNEIFNLAKLPKSIVIVGGGYIAVEFAGILHGLGVDVHPCSTVAKRSCAASMTRSVTT